MSGGATNETLSKLFKNNNKINCGLERSVTFVLAFCYLCFAGPFNTPSVTLLSEIGDL